MVSILWFAVSLKVIPNPNETQQRSRLRLVETTAIHVSLNAQRGQFHQMEQSLTELVNRRSELRGAEFLSPSGKRLVSVNPGKADAKPDSPTASADQMAIEVASAEKSWGSLVLHFNPHRNQGWLGLLAFPLPMIGFCGAMAVLLNWTYLSRVLKYLNPSKVVPGRVRTALDSINDGIVLMDGRRLIVLANQAFGRIVGLTPTELQGKELSQFPWKFSSQESKPVWQRAFESHCDQEVELITLASEDEADPVCFNVKSTPILTDDGLIRGVLTSFHDVTQLENKNEQLAEMLSALKSSRDEVQRKNRDLQILASVDPLTGCLNRRSFCTRFETYWIDDDTPRDVAILMIDIDHFKAVNDNHGHSAGDAVLRKAGEILREVAGKSGDVCRYGGEEFAIAFGDIGIDRAVEFADQILRKFRDTTIEGLKITVSIGVSARDQAAMDGQHLLDQADQCLYVAKRNGRDQIARWDRCDASDLVPEKNELKRQSDVRPSDSPPIAYPAVTALLSALGFRDRYTAEHCSRVARLSVAVGKRLLPHPRPLRVRNRRPVARHWQDRRPRRDPPQTGAFE